jgi:transcriptional regulator with XRE-family HTH domain
MKPFSDFLKKLPAARRARINEAARGKIAAIRIQQAREQLGVSQEDLADRLHMSQPALSRFERRPDVRLSTLARYAEALHGHLEVTLVVPKRQRGKGRSSPKRIALMAGA